MVCYEKSEKKAKESRKIAKNTLEIQGDRDERKANLEHHLHQPLGWTLQRRELLRLQHRGKWPLWPHWLQLHSVMRDLQRIRSCNGSEI